MKLSVIVPIYNVDAFLPQCLESIVRQKVEEMQIICVNDGSTDRSLHILEEYAAKDTRIQIIDKTNSGYGDSMNCGLAAAQGEYIAFVESDDSLVPDALPHLLAAADAIGADVVKGNYNYYCDGKRTYFDNMARFANGVVGEKDKEFLFFTAPSIWSAVYKRELLEENQIRFLPTPGAAYQDTSFAFKVWACAKKTAVLREPIIDYRIDNSQSSSNQNGKVFAVLRELEEIERFIVAGQREDLFPIAVKTAYLSAFWNINRLTLEAKLPFVLKVHELFKRAHEKGYIIKKYWADDEWELIHKFIYNLQWYCESIINGYSDSDLVVAIKQLRNISPVYIYGTDFNSRYILDVMNYHKVVVEAVVETDFLPRWTEFDGKPVLRIDQIKPEGIIVIGIAEQKEKAIQILKGYQLYNYIDFNLYSPQN